MSAGVDIRIGVDGFGADLATLCIDSHISGNALIYSVDAFGGVLAGQLVPTGVSIGELTGWPAVPPHWIHFPDTVRSR